ncbi:ROK family protein [Biostraticola tofi]|uniref:N-acetylglucosamine kinase n=1 Tax=Biostraticola tofi TaxID=466109 RepID=A0A4R3Z755_9GAMM|nr:ROK family protein [Biostraticola tofi]TCW00041.1 N-acetylglucosamine kinase [Biostraticola tofi]
MNAVVTPSPVLCADIGGSYIKFGLSPQPSDVVGLDKIAMPAHCWDEFVGALKKLVSAHQAHYAADTPLAISAAGIVSPTGEVFASNIPAFSGHLLVTELTQCLNRQVWLANDADCFALAEATQGRGKGLPIVFAAILGTGVGGGLVINGQTVSGADGLTGEWGHGPITRTELQLDGARYSLPRQPCSCGQSGCLDTYGGARGLEKIHLLLHGQSADSRTIIGHWQRDEPHARLTVAAWLQVVSEPLAYCLNMTGASLIVVGGGLAAVEPLIEALDRLVRQLILRRSPDPVVVAGRFSQQGGLVGASVLGHMRAAGR